MKCWYIILKEIPLDATYFNFEYRTTLDSLSFSLSILNLLL